MALPVFSNDQIADQLVRGYWEDQGGIPVFWSSQTLTVSLTALTGAGQTLARAALQVWSDATGFAFVETTQAGASITFDDNQPGAYGGSAYMSDGEIVSAEVNVSTNWLAAYGTSLNSYSFQTYIHEIGHALGLGHAGNYNGDAQYPEDALFMNDSWQATVMSYFSQDDNTSVDASFAFVVTPQADIVAMQAIYDWSSSARSGATVYGFNSTAGNVLFDATQFSDVAYTIVDSGGNDTLDYSGFAADQVIDLRQEAFSDIGGLVGNVAIGRGTVIENAIGGSGDDRLVGNSAVNVLKGGAGDDVYVVQTSGDSAVEANGAGNDRVESSVSYSLAKQYIEALTLTGTAAINATGNSLANTIIGNSARNVIDGGSGRDTMVGGGGDDDYVVQNAHDRVIELNGQGDDRVLSKVSFSLANQYIERLQLIGSADIAGTGNSLKNTIVGNAGDNLIDGGKRADHLAGGAGHDTFAFTTALGAKNVDIITDFNAVDDTIRLENAVFAGLSTGALGKSAFYAGTAAHDSSDRIIYNATSGGLFFDRDGTGATYTAVQFATLENHATTTAADFIVV
ncbi:M10 family metallopeptidase [Hansschlegelia quercus]|nr:M10 family metallopeptidase [Hansschlegelia quercus]